MSPHHSGECAGKQTLLQQYMWMCHPGGATVGYLCSVDGLQVPSHATRSDKNTKRKTRERRQERGDMRMGCQPLLMKRFLSPQVPKGVDVFAAPGKLTVFSLVLSLASPWFSCYCRCFFALFCFCGYLKATYYKDLSLENFKCYILKCY